MKRATIHILSTKILDEAIIEQAASENILIDCVSFIEIRPVNKPGLKQEVADAIRNSSYFIFTSANAVNAAAQHLDEKPRLKAFCISGKTRKSVESQFPGSTIIEDAPTGAELAEKIIAFASGNASKPESFTFFCGDKRLDTIPHTLNKNNIQLNEVVVYQTVLTPKKIEKDYAGILFFSPSAVESFFNINQPPQAFAAFSFAGSTFQSLRAVANEIIISHTPSEQAMLNTVIGYYKP